jgi:hypothetical protein
MEQIWLEGNQRLTLTTVRPYRSAFSSSSRTSVGSSPRDLTTVIRAYDERQRPHREMTGYLAGVFGKVCEDFGAVLTQCKGPRAP